MPLVLLFVFISPDMIIRDENTDDVTRKAINKYFFFFIDFVIMRRTNKGYFADID